MPFSSSPSLEDGTEGADAGTPLQFGGNSQDAQRQAQLQALQQSQAEAVAAQQKAVEDDMRQREYAAQSEHEHRQLLLRQRKEQRDKQQAFACNIVLAGILLGLLAMAHRGLTSS